MRPGDSVGLHHAQGVAGSGRSARLPCLSPATTACSCEHLWDGTRFWRAQTVHNRTLLYIKVRNQSLLYLQLLLATSPLIFLSRKGKGLVLLLPPLLCDGPCLQSWASSELVGLHPNHFYLVLQNGMGFISILRLLLRKKLWDSWIDRTGGT